MINNKNMIAIIPARGGSKGIPRKNIKELNGQPLISYIIKALRNSKYIDRIIVSTDDYEIAEVSKKYGAEVPFLRPQNLAQDTTSSMEVILHCINWLRENEGYEANYTGLFQCTSPFTNTKHINEAIENLYNNHGNSIVSVCESNENPYWMKKIINGKLVDFINNDTYIRRQDLPKIYSLNGAIYIAKTNFLLKNKTWYNENTLSYIMKKEESVDIDSLLDFYLAEMIIKNNLL